MDPRARRRAGAVAGVACTAVIAAVACETTTLTGTLSIITGPDNGFLANPEPTNLVVDFINSGTGASTFAAQTRLPSDGGLSLPSQPGANVDNILITGFDDAGDAVVSGTTIPIALDQFSGLTVNVFVQRTGQFSRLPAADGSAAAIIDPPGPVPLMTNLYNRYLLIADGTGKSTQTQLYDTLFWQTEPEPPCLAIPSLSLAFVEQYTGVDATPEASTVAAVLGLGQNGAASWLDITDSTGCGPDASVASDAMTPDGGAFALAAGGQTILTPPSPYGNTYIVGGTRQAGEPTNGVLRISQTGVMTWTRLNYPRLGAAAAYLAGVAPTPGVFVFGGTAADAGAKEDNGVEFVSDDTSLPPVATIPSMKLPADTTTGAGAVALDPYTVLLAGGVTADGKPAPVRIYSIEGGDAAVAAMCGASGADAGSSEGGAADDAAKDAPGDAPHDAPRDVAEDVAHDAAHDAGRDAALRDATVDATRDATLDAAHDATLHPDAATPSLDAARDAGRDAEPDTASFADVTPVKVDASRSASGWPTLPVTFVSTQVFALRPPSSPTGPSVMVVGTEKSGETSAYVLTCTGVTRVPFHFNRKNARAILLANGSLAVVGGDAGGTMESYIP